MKKGTNDRLPLHFRDFIVALNSNDVEYMVIGGYALGAYGHIRATNDLDIFIHATDQNASKMLQACIDYGIPERSLQKEMFLVEKMIGIGDPPLRIEIMKKADIVDFQYAAQRTKTITVDGVPVKVISLDDLILLNPKNPQIFPACSRRQRRSLGTGALRADEAQFLDNQCCTKITLKILILSIAQKPAMESRRIFVAYSHRKYRKQFHPTQFSIGLHRSNKNCRGFNYKLCNDPAIRSCWHCTSIHLSVSG